MSSEFDHKFFLKHLSNQSGVYQMIGQGGEVLYVGKAHNLKKRVSSYFRSDTKNPRIASLVKQIQDIKVIITSSDNEALLLENNLIKKFLPRYNVLFRDDKSYAYIYLSKHKKFPRLDFYRGSKTEEGYYFGPYSNSTAVRESLNLLQKLFKVRQCSDVFFNSRTRPCIQYQIKRCTAPCVHYVSEEDYQQQVRLTRLFLDGKNKQLLQELMVKMTESSEKMDYEEAARYRDQITNLRKIQEKQYIYHNEADMDVMVIIQEHKIICIEVLFFRNGRMMGEKSYFPKIQTDTPEDEIIASFASQYYLSKNNEAGIPAQIFVNVLPEDKNWLEDALTESVGHKVKISKPERGEKLHWIALAKTNAENALKQHLVSKHHYFQQMTALQEALKLQRFPTRLECYDVSHTFGEATIASCVVFNDMGPDKRAYRRYNITDIQANDDYAALRQVLTRRLKKLKEGEQVAPDIMIIDGGKGQLKQAEAALEELQISGIVLLAIAKGPTRKAGFETIFYKSNSHVVALQFLPDEVMHLLQHIRDEAHRFAITGHRKQRDKRRLTSPIEAIPGIGKNRRRQLLNYFGGLQELKCASEIEIAKVPGISKMLAKEIYDYFHSA
ncbi:MAG: excinuclease ABC subunit UvrC [Gammaproteobacteria bacterium]